MGVDNAKAAWCDDGKGENFFLQSFTHKLSIKVWLCWTIFAIKIVCAPLNLIFGGVFYNASSEEPHLPPLMIAGGLLEVGLASSINQSIFIARNNPSGFSNQTRLT